MQKPQCPGGNRQSARSSVENPPIVPEELLSQYHGWCRCSGDSAPKPRVPHVKAIQGPRFTFDAFNNYQGGQWHGHGSGTFSIPKFFEVWGNA